MQNITKVSKIFLIFTLLFFTLWFGSYITRLAVVYRFFEPESLTLKQIYTSQNLDLVLKSILPLFLINIIAYAAFIVLFAIFLIISKVNLKNEGWLFISVLIVFICAPFEIYLLAKDFNISKLILAENFDVGYVAGLIKERTFQLSSFSLIEIFSFIGVIFLAVFQPLRKSK